MRIWCELFYSIDKQHCVLIQCSYFYFNTVVLIHLYWFITKLDDADRGFSINLLFVLVGCGPKITGNPRCDTEFYFDTNPLKDHSFLLIEIQRHGSWNVPVLEYHDIFLYTLIVFLFCHSSVWSKTKVRSTKLFKYLISNTQFQFLNRV